MRSARIPKGRQLGALPIVPTVGTRPRLYCASTGSSSDSWLLILLAVIIMFAVAWMLAWPQVPAKPGSMECMGVGLTFLIPFFFYARTVCRMPIEITIDEEARVVWFRCVVGSRRCVPADAFISIRRGDLWESNRLNAVIRHEAGKVVLSYPFRDFRDFLERLKALNPSVEIKGF